MVTKDGSVSFYFFDIDDNLLFLPTQIYLWNAEKHEELSVSSGQFASIQNELGRSGQWAAWSVGLNTFRDFRDLAGVSFDEQPFLRDIRKAMSGTSKWLGPSWPLFVHALRKQRPVAFISARGHSPETIGAGLELLASQHGLPSPNILGVYTVSNADVRQRLGAADAALTIPSVKKLAIKDAVKTALTIYGEQPAHRFGMSDDDPNNVVLAISAMRDCKEAYPDKRFFVINTNEHEFVKLEVFTMLDPVTADEVGRPVLADTGAPSGNIFGGNVSVYVSNMDRAVKFYTDSLGLQLRTRIGAEWAEIDAGAGLIIGLHPANPPITPAPGAAGAINIELKAVQTLESVVDTLKARGVAFEGGILNYENVRLATLSDPDGNKLLLAQVLFSGSAP